MERLELAISGVEQVLRPASPPAAVPAQLASLGPRPGGAVATAALPTWLDVVRHQLPRLMEALDAEDTSTGDHGLTERARRLARERNRLLRRVRQLVPSLSDDRLAAAGLDHDELRRMLLRLLHDISHHHQRVNDMVYDAGWRDVGGSE
jgi:hypothetical protein